MKRMTETFEKDKASIIAECNRRIKEEQERESTFSKILKVAGGAAAAFGTLATGGALPAAVGGTLYALGELLE